MAVSAYAIPTLAQVKNFLNIGVSATDTTQDTVLEGWIDQCSYEIETYCNRKFAVQSVASEIHDGDSSNILYPKYSPVTQISTVTTPADADKLAAIQYRTSPDGSWTNLLTNVNNIFTDLDWLYIKLYGTVFPAGERNILVSYKAGYSTLPGDIVRVAIEMVAMYWKRSNYSSLGWLGKGSKSDSGSGLTFSESLLDMGPGWKAVLESYRVQKRYTSQTSLSR